MKWALTDRASDAAFKQELAAHEQRTQQMLKELLREKDALAARDTVIAELRAELRSAKSVAADAAPRRRRAGAADAARRRPAHRAPGRRATPPAPRRRRRRGRRGPAADAARPLRAGTDVTRAADAPCSAVRLRVTIPLDEAFITRPPTSLTPNSRPLSFPVAPLSAANGSPPAAGAVARRVTPSF